MSKIIVIKGPIDPSPILSQGAIWVDNPDVLVSPSIAPTKIIFKYVKPLNIPLKNREITILSNNQVFLNGVSYTPKKKYPILKIFKDQSIKIKTWGLRKKLNTKQKKIFKIYKSLLWADFKFNNPEFWGNDRFYEYELKMIQLIIDV